MYLLHWREIEITMAAKQLAKLIVISGLVNSDDERETRGKTCFESTYLCPTCAQTVKHARKPSNIHQTSFSCWMKV